MRLACVPLLLLVLLAACASNTLDLKHDHDPSVDFSGFKTWAWMNKPAKEKPDPRVDNALTVGRITRSIESVLKEKGFRKVTRGANPDFIVGYHAAIQTKVQIDTINQYYEYSRGWGWEYGLHDPGWGGSHGTISQERVAREYDQGSLIIDIAKPKNKTLIWRGAAQAEMDEKERTPEEREADLRDAIRQILAPFPPGRESSQPK